MAQEAGFASAVSTIPGVVEAKGHTNLHALPRIAWDGRQGSLRMMRVMLSGACFRRSGRPGTIGLKPARSGRDIQLMIGIAGSTHPSPATT